MDKLWKRTERRIAKELGGQRNSLSGSNSKVTSGDVIHDRFYVEIKERKRIPFYKVIEETIKNAKQENKIPLIVIHEKGRKNDLVILRLRDFKEVIK